MDKPAITLNKGIFVDTRHSSKWFPTLPEKVPIVKFNKKIWDPNSCSHLTNIVLCQVKEGHPPLNRKVMVQHPRAFK